MGLCSVSFFQTAPHNHALRYAILCNTIAFILILFGFGYSFSISPSSTVKLTLDVFSTEFDDSSVFAKLGPLQISLNNANESVVCPRDDANYGPLVANASAAAWTECELYAEASKTSLGFDGITFIALIIIFCLQRYATTRIADEQTLVQVYLALQAVPCFTHLLARLLFDSVAARRAIAFLKENRLGGVSAAVSDDSVGMFYGPVQRLHTTAACFLSIALAAIVLNLVRVVMQKRIDSVELVRECAARRRAEASSPAEKRPLRWMLDPAFHPLFDRDELAVIKQRLALKTLDRALEAQLEIAEAEWRRQQEELLNEEDAFAEYAHRIRREERVEGRVVVDDWQRQQEVWEQRKMAVMRQFEQMGLVASPPPSPTEPYGTAGSPQKPAGAAAATAAPGAKRAADAQSESAAANAGASAPPSAEAQ